MKTKVFTLNKNNKIEFTEKELKKLLDEMYNDGYEDGKRNCTYVYTTPYRNPWNWSYTTTASNDYTINTSDTTGTITLNKNDNVYNTTTATSTRL